MPQRPMKYNPAFLTEEELVQSFVVRDADLKLIVDAVRENVGESNQHLLVIGPRGMGKTMLVLRAVAEVRRDETLRDKWYPLVFAEESYEVTTPGEFWLEALFHLWHQTKDDRWGRTYEDLRREPDETRLRERALAQLMDFADSRGKRILLVVENLNMMLGDQIGDDDAWVLRHTLQHEPRVMMLTSATTRFAEVENSGKAMFEVFKPLRLQPLTQDECRKVWVSFTGQEPPENQIRPIQILTGGSPRLLAIISTFAAGRSFNELMEDLTQLVDDHTEYFKTHLDNLAPIERKVYLALAEIWDPATARSVAEAARLDVNKTSSLLQRLIGRGAVVISDDRRRTKWYQVAERLYNIYYLMRRRGSPSNRVRAVVNFMISFYGEEDLIRITRSIAEEAFNLDIRARENHYFACESILRRASDGVREKILREIPRGFLESTEAPPSLRELVANVRERPLVGIDQRLRSGLAPEEETKRPQTPEEEQAHDLFKRAEALRRSGNMPEAEQAYRKALELQPENTLGWALLGALLQQDLKRYAEAEQAYRKGVELRPDFGPGWVLLGALLQQDLKRYAEAEQAYRKAVELQPENTLGWALLGALLQQDLKRYAEAEEAYRKAIELKPDDAWVWAQLGQLLHEDLKRYAEAEESYRKAIELKPDDAWAWAQLGQLLHEDLKRYAEAEEAYRKAIELDPDHACPWGHLGRLLHEALKRYAEAEEAYRKAIELSPGLAWVWAYLGQLLHEDLKRHAEAEEAYRKATELEPENWRAWIRLVELLLEQDGRLSEVFELADKCSKGHPENVILLNGLAWAFYSTRSKVDLGRAEAWAREAVRLSPDESNCQHTYACILCAVNKGREALTPAEKYFNDATLVSKAIDDAIELGVQLAVAGVAREAVAMLQESPSAAQLEPLIVGLKVFLREEVKAAAEILEVGKDVAKRISERKGSRS